MISCTRQNRTTKHHQDLHKGIGTEEIYPKDVDFVDIIAQMLYLSMRTLCISWNSLFFLLYIVMRKLFTDWKYNFSENSLGNFFSGNARMRVGAHNIQ